MHQQREREKALGELPKPPASTVVMTPAGLLTVPNPYRPASPETPSAADGRSGGSPLAHSPTGVGGFAVAPTSVGYGAGWLLEQQTRQAKEDALEAQAEHFRGRMLRERLARLRQRQLRLVWQGWLGLLEASRKRQQQRLAKMAGSIVAAHAAEGAKAGTDHAEWWQKGSPEKKKKHHRAPVNLKAMV